MQWSRPACRAPGEARSNVEAFAAIARRLGLSRAVWDVTEASLCAELLERSAARFTPAERAALHAGEAVKLAPRAVAGWGTPSGKVELASARAEALGQPAVATFVEDDDAGDAGAFRLIPAPSRATHNSTFHHSPRHLRRAGPPTAWLAPADAAALGVAAGDRVRLSNARAALTLLVGVTEDQPPGTVRVDGMPRAADVPEGVGVNALVSPALADLGDGNVLYSARVDVERVGAGR
jgi:anaerobic selenocysteine-containing dehydrogenase